MTDGVERFVFWREFPSRILSREFLRRDVDRYVLLFRSRIKIFIR